MHAIAYLQRFLVEERVALSEAVALGRNRCRRSIVCVRMTFSSLRLLPLRFRHRDLCDTDDKVLIE